MSRIKSRKVSRIPQFYDYAILKRIYLILENTNALTELEKIIMHLILNHALTYKELQSIKISDIDWRGKFIYIDKGNGYYRYVFLEKNDLIFLMRYIQEGKNSLSFKNHFYLLQKNGYCLNDYDYKKVIKKTGDILGVKLTLRNLRNTFIRYALDLNVSIIYIKKYLGLRSYSSLTKFEVTTVKYLSYSKNHIDDIRGKLSLEKKNKLQQNIQNLFDDSNSKINVLNLDKISPLIL